MPRDFPTDDHATDRATDDAPTGRYRATTDELAELEADHLELELELGSTAGRHHTIDHRDHRHASAIRVASPV